MRNLCFSVLILPALLGPGCQRSPTPPNILFIMTDDHGEQAISAYGSRLIETPNIDRIAQGGIRFDNAFVTNSICAPSRAVFLTGKYSHLNGLRDNRDEFDGSQVTLPKLLQGAGYQTAVIGKWHLKTDPTGFDVWRILVDQGEYYNPRFIEMGEEITREGYVTTVITDLAIQYLEARDPDKPFLLLYHHKAPHRNWMPDVKHLDLYEDRDLPLPETFFDRYEGRQAAAEQDMRVVDMYLGYDLKLERDAYEKETGTGGSSRFDADAAWARDRDRLTPEQRAGWDAHYGPISQSFKDSNLQGRALDEWKYQRYIKDYLRCVVSVDENVGRVLDYLEREGLTDNTVVVYTSDQGFYLGEHGWYDKRFMYEESLGTPLLVRYPREVPAGTTAHQMVMNLDFAPTLLDYAGVPIPKDMQGASFRSLARGEPAPDWRDAIYYHYYEYPHGWHKVKRHYGMRTDRYKLIHFYDDIDTWELFDLKQDPHEIRNLHGSEEYGQVEKTLRQRLSKLREQYGDVADQ